MGKILLTIELNGIDIFDKIKMEQKLVFQANRRMKCHEEIFFYNITYDHESFQFFKQHRTM